MHLWFKPVTLTAIPPLTISLGLAENRRIIYLCRCDYEKIVKDVNEAHTYLQKIKHLPENVNSAFFIILSE